jgi:hypothetical protein
MYASESGIRNGLVVPTDSQDDVPIAAEMACGRWAFAEFRLANDLVADFDALILAPNAASPAISSTT